MLSFIHRPSSPTGERPIMGKILSFAYASEWDKNREKWYEENKKHMQKPQKDSDSEYQSAIGQKSVNSRPNSMQRLERYVLTFPGNCTVIIVTIKQGCAILAIFFLVIVKSYFLHNSGCTIGRGAGCNFRTQNSERQIFVAGMGATPLVMG